MGDILTKSARLVETIEETRKVPAKVGEVAKVLKAGIEDRSQHLQQTITEMEAEYPKQAGRATRHGTENSLRPSLKTWLDEDANMHDDGDEEDGKANEDEWC